MLTFTDIKLQERVSCRQQHILCCVAVILATADQPFGILCQVVRLRVAYTGGRWQRVTVKSHRRATMQEGWQCTASGSEHV